MTSSRLIEELTFNAWPPLETLLFDGWLIGFAGGYTRRANSVQPLYASSWPLGEKVAECEAMFAARGRPTVFKLTSTTADPGLDDVLERRGYVEEAPTSVQTAALAGFTGKAVGVSLETRLIDGWLAAFNRLTSVPPELHTFERALLQKITPPHCFASIALDGEIVALGLGVAERRHVGLFDIVVDVRMRQQGIGRRLCAALMDWGHRAELADTAYLAVMQSNAQALRLYASLGFREQYTYWYRTRLS
jgi:N-acetylglutamate synthase